MRDARVALVSSSSARCVPLSQPAKCAAIPEKPSRRTRQVSRRVEHPLDAQRQSQAPAKQVPPKLHEVPSGAFVHAFVDWRGWQRAHGLIGDVVSGAYETPSIMQFGKCDVHAPPKHAMPVPHAAPSVMLDHAFVDVSGLQI